MRRVLALVGALLLIASLAGSAVAVTRTVNQRFTGDFDVIDPANGEIAGHVTAQFVLPTEGQVAPGTFQFTGASWYPIKAMRTAVADALFWIDPNGGLPHAMEVGAECDISWPGGYECHGDWAVMFREVPGEPNSILMSPCRIGPSSVDFSFDEGCGVLLWVGKGDWVLKVAPE
jgi:hypothetical protein